MKVDRYTSGSRYLLITGAAFGFGIASLIWKTRSVLLFNGAFVIMLLAASIGFVLLRQRMRAQRNPFDSFSLLIFSRVEKRQKFLYASVLAASILAILFEIAGLVFRLRFHEFNIAGCVFGAIFVIAALLYLGPLLRRVEELHGVFEKGTAEPPKSAKFLLLLIPRKHREYLVGDLEEEYRTILLPEYGPRAARRWYWWHVCISIGPLVWENLKRVAGLVLLWRSVR